MRHTHTIQFYDSIGDCSTARDTVPRFQCFTELPKAYPIHHTDRSHVLAYEQNKCLRAGLLSCRRQRTCGGRRKISRRGCFAEVPHIMPYSLGCTFWRCSLKLLVVESEDNYSLHILHTTLSVGSTSLQSTAQNPKYFQTSLFRFLGVTITFSAAVKQGSALSAIY